MNKVSYRMLNQDLLTEMPAGTVILLGTLVAKEEDLYLSAPDGATLKIRMTDEADIYKLADYEDESILLVGTINGEQIQAKSWARFESSIDTKLYQETFLEMQKHPQLFCADAEESLE
ncbi:hypothetical protein NEHOM01_0650 [Nematocida homosporus]|uniref:uncharacterized protein n=1 Tax=Nematocida homosporus TaxID=1912981 RepID=UPI00222052B5|nr:uncharacterized protein NEHOM01_0650 [Nematocida homosporus]KAI5185145.1 hypothetical protein NEHOM01_0650 [Nematocida homosporus]